MLTISDKNIILGSMGGVSLPDGWGAGWLAPPAIVDNGDGTGAINGVAAMAWLLCPAYPVANNRFYWIANSSTGNTTYTVKNADGSVLYTEQKAFNAAFDYEVDYSKLVGDSDDFGARQYIVEITPTTSGASLTSAVFQPFPLQSSITTIDAAVVVNPFAFDWRFRTLQYLRAVTPTTSGIPLVGSYAKIKKFTSTATSIGSDGYSYGTEVVDINYPNAATFSATTALANNSTIVCAKINAPNVAQSGLIIFGDGTSPAATRNLRKCLMPGFRCGFSVRYCDMSAAALNALSDSLGTAYTTGQVLDYRNNPGSAACDTSIATAKGYTVLTA